jgi:hypothetical protein
MWLAARANTKEGPKIPMMSSVFLLRAFAFLVLPLLLAGGICATDKSVNTRERRLEVFLVYMFAFGGALGILSGMGHLFASNQVAESIGWPIGSPFQLEMGFANLAVGVLAAMSVGRRDGFRDATVIAGAILGFGAFSVHMLDLVQHNNLSPGNTLVNITNLGRPIIYIYLLWSLRGIERTPASEKGSRAFAAWQGKQAVLGGMMGAGVGIGTGFGIMVNMMALGMMAGLVAGAALGWVQRSRLP